MSLKAKIIEKLKTKYKSLGFSDKSIDAAATYLDGTVTEEDKIDDAVTGVESMLKAFQGDADKRVTDAVKKAQTEKQEEKKEEKEKTPPTNDDVPTWAQGLIESNKALLDKVNKLEAGKTTDTRKTELEALLKDTPDTFRNMKLKDFGRMNFKDDEEFNTYKTELSEGLEGMKDIFAGQQGADTNKSIPAPAFGTKGKNGISSDTQAYIDAKKAEGAAKTEGKKIFET